MANKYSRKRCLVHLKEIGIDGWVKTEYTGELSKKGVTLRLSPSDMGYVLVFYGGTLYVKSTSPAFTDFFFDAWEGSYCQR